MNVNRETGNLSNYKYMIDTAYFASIESLHKEIVVVMAVIENL
jgi:hypothetical protein